ncbi:hypothetical protein JIG36_06950 [Actinoplanes sp. LDG1-06]|uniref:Uncharacterized protein n=1 Tax=Paractinoplanes ovalisporus TaxID=2810368 RepID=A0ABS2A623_9ACTN|nr:hypothetical protein [Actinoplanes ovalisporus]MBM2615299.1 hypothetical protein [Actinoplanes ovalisporus]
MNENQRLTSPDVGNVNRRRAIAESFLAAAKGGQLDRLLALLDPEAVLQADSAAVTLGATAVVNGAAGVAGVFNGRAQTKAVALLEGVPGLVEVSEGHVIVVFHLSFDDEAGWISAVEQVADKERITATVVG